MKIIYFSGPDGSGKTTTFLNVRDQLQKDGHSVFSLRTLQVGRLKMMMHNKKNKDFSGDNSLGNIGRRGYSDLKRDRNDGTLKYKIRRYIGLLVALVDIIIFGRIYITSLSKEYDYLLVEESPFDSFVKRHRPFYKKTSYLFSRLLPKANLIIFCKAEPDIIHKRKPELTVDEIIDYYIKMNILYYDKKNLFYNNTNHEGESDIELKESIESL
jgi:hypothetical protein